MKKRQTESDRLATTYNEGSLVRLGAQRIVVFEALILHVDSSAHPMHVILIDREDDDIQGKDVDLRKMSVYRS